MMVNALKQRRVLSNTFLKVKPAKAETEVFMDNPAFCPERRTTRADTC